MNARAGLYRCVAHHCPECGFASVRDIEDDRDPYCSDRCRFHTELAQLVRSFGRALSTAEMAHACENVLARPDGEAGHEHPASIALHGLGEAYETKIQKYLAGGDRNAALILSGVRSDLEHVREML